MFCNVSRVLLCGSRNTVATFSEDAWQSSWQAQHNLDVSIVIFRGRRSTLDVWCGVFFANRIGMAARKELEEIQKKAAQEGRTVEIIPSKLVFTIKSGPNGGKRKTRWVICGNYESKKDSEKTFSSGADAAAFRLSICAASRHQWAGAVIDIKTSLLNALMDQGDQEAILIVRPPALFTEKGYMAPQSLPTLCISKRFNSCSWCHPVSESV